MRSRIGTIWAFGSTSTVLFHNRVTAQRARELPLHVNAPTECNGVERAFFGPTVRTSGIVLPFGGTTDERRPSFQLYTLVIGGRRKRSGVRAGRAREKAGFSGGRQTRAAAPTRQASSRPSEKSGSPDARAAGRPTPAGSGATSRSGKNTRSASRSACSPAPTRSATFADPSENPSAGARPGENTNAGARPGEKTGTAGRPPRCCAAPAGSD